jgi:peptide/nickel transport system permease protein
VDAPILPPGELPLVQSSSRPAATRGFLRGTFASPLAKIGAALILVHVGIALTGVIWQPSSTAISTDITAAPSLRHLFGTDQLGRDIFYRILDGSAKILGISAAVALSSTVIGAAIGAFAAYRKGIPDLLLMRIVDVLLSFPVILVALLAAALLPAGYLSIYLVVVGVHIPQVTRVARGVFADALARDYVTVARLRGESVASILVREALPNAVGPLSVEFALRWNYSVILIASLNFLGVGVQPPAPDWGLMLFDARDQLLVAPWAALAPALALASLAVAINFTADGLSSALAGRSFVRKSR